MAAVYEDNFGFWEIDSREELAFFSHVQSQSIRVTCQRCKRSVRLMRTKTVCSPCVSALECGAPASMKEYGRDQTTLLDPRRPSRRLLRPRVR
jgi:hypothetical protein